MLIFQWSKNSVPVLLSNLSYKKADLVLVRLKISHKYQIISFHAPVACKSEVQVPRVRVEAEAVEVGVLQPSHCPSRVAEAAGEVRRIHSAPQNSSSPFRRSSYSFSKSTKNFTQIKKEYGSLSGGEKHNRRRSQFRSDESAWCFSADKKTEE